MRKRIISTGIKLVVTIGLFVFLFRPQTFGFRPDLFGGVTPLKMLRELQQAKPSNVLFWVGLAVLVKLSGMLAGVIRWRLLLRGQGLSIPFWYLVQSWFVGRFFGIFVPGTIGLDGYRLYDSSMYTGEVIKCASVIAVEKLIGFIALTFLVFLTFPLGFRLLNINGAILGITLLGLSGFVVASFLLLLNPRVLQVLAAVVPVPAFLRGKIDKLGASITAYSGRLQLLMSAVLCGLWVHLATCFMYFCTMMSLRAPNTSLLDIFFASPIMIYGTVIGPSVGGEGIREIVFATLLGAKSGVITAVLFAHLGWWVDNVVPFLIGAPILVLRSRPRAKELAATLAAARQEVAAQQREATQVVHLAGPAIAAYRAKLVDCAAVGIGAGLIAGAVAGIAEASWLKATLEAFPDFSAFWWGPLVYGLLFAAVGLGVAGGLAFLYLLLDRFAPAFITFGLCLGGSLFASVIIGLFRYRRDIGHEHPLTLNETAGILGTFGAVALLGIGIGFLVGYLLRRPRFALPALSCGAFLAVVAVGSAYGKTHTPASAPVPKLNLGTSAGEETAKAKPNIILIAEDALRADYLKMYSEVGWSFQNRPAGEEPVLEKPAHLANTPNLDAFKKDAVLFANWFSQASWTKPSFGTIFSGRYPNCHTATTPEQGLPKDVVTFPRILTQGGYFTKGFANNGNIFSVFNFGLGFSSYIDLQPRRLFFAGESAARLSLYEALRRGYLTGLSKVTSKINIRDFDQPADVLTKIALDWIDGEQRPKNAPFFLFLHYMDTHDPFMDHHHPGVGYARATNQKPDPGKFLEKMRSAYIGDIEYLDTYLGVLFDGLKQRGLYDNTIIIFTSDHGEEFFDHGGWWHGQTLYDELIHVPMLFKLAGNAKGGQVNSSFARHLDIAPTILKLVGLQPVPEMSGKAILDANGICANGDIASVYAENDFENNVLQALRTHDAKDIHANPGNPRGQAPLSLFDLQADPAEKINLAGKGDPREPALEGELDKMIQFTKDCPKSAIVTPQISQDLKQELENIGYLGTDKAKKKTK